MEAKRGLTSAEAARRLAVGGPNVIAAAERPRHLRHVAVILINAIFAFVQEYRAERASDALRLLVPQQARVVRDGEPRDIPAEHVVTGDLPVLRAGDRVAADAELLTRTGLRVDASTLTGESRPVEPEQLVYAHRWWRPEWRARSAASRH